MALLSSSYMAKLAISVNFGFLFVDPETQSGPELIRGTCNMMLALAAGAFVLAFLMLILFKKDASFLEKGPKNKVIKEKELSRNEHEVTQLTTEERTFMKGKDRGKGIHTEVELNDMGPQNHQLGVSQEVVGGGEESTGLTFMEQLIGILRDPCFVLIGLSSMFMSTSGTIYTDNFNAMAASFGFPEVRIHHLPQKFSQKLENYKFFALVDHFLETSFDLL